MQTTLCQKNIFEISDLLTFQIVNGSVLFYLKNFTFENVFLVIKYFHITNETELLIWITITYSIVRMVSIICSWTLWGKLWRWIVKIFLKVKPKIKSVYVKVVEKVFRRQRRQNK